MTLKLSIFQKALNLRRRMKQLLIMGMLIFSFLSQVPALANSKPIRYGPIFGIFDTTGIETINGSKMSSRGGFQLGWLASQRMGFYGELAGGFFDRNNLGRITFLDITMNTIIYPMGNVFMRLGSGISINRSQIESNLSTKTRYGVTGNFSLGYELRTGANNYFSPEVALNYHRIAGKNYLSVQFGFAFVWHF